MATFESLPYDVHYIVVRLLDFESALALKKTSRLFYAHVDLWRLPAETIKVFIIKAGRFARNEGYRACFTCLQLLPKANFGDTQRRKGTDGKASLSRICWDCAARRGLYQTNHAVKRDKRSFYHCGKCDLWSPDVPRCGVQPLREGRAWIREHTRNISHPGWQCWDGSPEATLPGLPEAVQDRIFGMLNYRDAIMLSQTCRSLRARNGMRLCSLQDKCSFTFAKEKEIRAADPGRYACYYCFRVRPASKFAVDAVTSASHELSATFKRCCSHCYRSLHCDLGPADRAALELWKQRKLCLECNTLRQGGDRCPNCPEEPVSIGHLEVDDPVDSYGQLEEALGEYDNSIQTTSRQGEPPLPLLDFPNSRLAGDWFCNLGVDDRVDSYGQLEEALGEYDSSIKTAFRLSEPPLQLLEFTNSPLAGDWSNRGPQVEIEPSRGLSRKGTGRLAVWLHRVGQLARSFRKFFRD